MPYTVSISRSEADLLQNAGVKGLDGTIFTYDPADTMKVLAEISSSADADATQRLQTRLGTLYGRYLVAQARKGESAQAPNEDEPDLFSVPAEEPPAEEQKPEQVTKPRRSRAS